MNWYCLELWFRGTEFREQGLLWLEEHEIASSELLEQEESKNSSEYGIRIYVEQENQAQKLSNNLKSSFPPNVLCNVTVSLYQEQDWMELWREKAEAKELCSGIWAGPPESLPSFISSETSEQPTPLWFPIIPRLVFGSGHHETTSLMVQALVHYRSPFQGASLLDIGTGSGILTFIAKELGARQVVGFDIEPLCVSNIRENQLENSSRVGDFFLGSLDCLKETWNPKGLLINMIRTEAEPLIQKAFSSLCSKGICIWSGLQQSDKPRAVEHMEQLGGYLQIEWSKGEWWCGGFVKKPL